jgi:transcriptional regulator with XRE-family HTH domain/tetratricopeptide (TPR) repeat protein
VVGGVKLLKDLKMKPKPNQRLRHERELRGWSQARVAREIGTLERNVSRWERGVSSPYPHFREKLCALYGKSARELGFMEDENEQQADPTQQQTLVPSSLYDPLIPPAPNEGRELVGRQELLARLLDQVCSGQNVALSGLPGVGKTALVLALVHHQRVRDTFRDGVLWVGLGPQPNLPEQLSRWGTLLGLLPSETAQESSLDTRAVALRAAIGRRRMVLVIDDAWDLEAALPFKVGGPECVLLVTTRFPGIAWSLVHNGVHVVHELTSSDGLALLAQQAPEVVALDKPAAQALVQEVGGLPLALTLMGKYLQTQAHSGQPRRVQTALTRLRDAPQRLRLSEPQSPVERSPSLTHGTPLSLQSAIAVSDQQLSEAAREVLRALAVFPPKPNSFSEEAALAVARAPVEILDQLSDAGLLESSGAGRYTLHQTIADYASAHLRETLAGERLVAYVVAYLEKHTTDYAALEAESRNILAGLKYAFEAGQHVRFVQGAMTFVPFLLARGLYDQARLHLQRAYHIAIWSKDMLTVTKALIHLGYVAYTQEDYNQAEAHLREGLALARERADHQHVREALTYLARIAEARGDIAQMKMYLQEAAALAQ